MSGENPRKIPRIQLPQIGSPSGEDPAPEDVGTVRRADTHHDEFVAFLSSGEGLDHLIDSVERDTVGPDGRTPIQRDLEAEQARQESVMRKHAVQAPVFNDPHRSSSVFDNDTDDADDASHTGDTGGAGVDNGDGAGDRPTGLITGHSAEPPPEPRADPPRAEPMFGVAPPARPPTQPVAAPATSPTEDMPVSSDDIGGSEGLEDCDHHGTLVAGDIAAQPSVNAATAGPELADELPPVGSLWDSTHSESDDYDPGDMVVDPAPVRAEPGPLTAWIQGRYRKHWAPLKLQTKIGVGLAVAAAVWAGVAVVGNDSSPSGPSSQAASPIVDVPPVGGPSTPSVLTPDKVEAPGCPARSQPPVNAFDGRPETAWVCIRAFDTDLQTIILTYNQPVVVDEIEVVPGFEFTDSNGRNKWDEHRIVTQIWWQLGGQSFRQDINPAAHTGATIEIPNVATQVIIGKVFRTVPPPPTQGDNGPSDEDINSTFAVSRITVLGQLAGGQPR